MANLNKVMLIGRLTRDPEVRTFANGGKVAAFGFAVNNPKKNPTTGQWESEPVFLDVEAFNREQGRRLADTVEQYMRKGHQVFIEGHLKLDQWTDKNDGQKRQRLKIVVDNCQLLEPRADGGMSEGGMQASRGAPAPRRMGSPPPGANEFEEPGHEPGAFEPPPAPRGEEEIPF